MSDGVPAPLADRIVLGTAQLGLPYGRRRLEETMPEEMAAQILDAAWSLGVRAFDTSEAYGAAAPRLARWLETTGRLGQGRVVTKVVSGGLAIGKQVEMAGARFRGAAEVTVLSHGAIEGESWRALQRAACRSGLIAGQSVYTANEVARAHELGATRVQAPGNVLDTRQLDVSHALGVPIDLRSVFLQGVLLDARDVAEGRVSGGGALATGVQAAASAVELRPAVALLAGMHEMLGRDDRLVIGIDDLCQLDDIVDGLHASVERVGEFLARMEPLRESVRQNDRLLDPRTWS